MNNHSHVLIIGAGLAGSEAAWFLASRGVRVTLVECKKSLPTPAQKMKTYAELVCTNSLKSLDPTTAHGMLKYEMQAMGSLVLSAAHETRVPADMALAVDRHLFSELMTQKLKSHPLIRTLDIEATDPLSLALELECTQIIVASGPLTSPALEKWITKEIAAGDFYFYDAIAPVVDADSLDISKMYFKGRHSKEEVGGDYLNVPFTKEEYNLFMEELAKAEKVPPKDFEEERFFEACLPIDLMAERGLHTARFSCMKPMGLERPDGTRPWAVLQLRKENLLGSAYNLVGFQTRLTYKEQARIWRMIPGFSEAEFIHYGQVHRNSFLNARVLLNADLSSKKYPNLYFAGQMTGVEGYTESAAMGLYVAYQLWRKLQGKPEFLFPVETAIGALVHYLMTVPEPRPSSINVGLFPDVELSREEAKGKGRKSAKRSLISKRQQKAFNEFWPVEKE